MALVFEALLKHNTFMRRLPLTIIDMMIFGPRRRRLSSNSARMVDDMKKAKMSQTTGP